MSDIVDDLRKELDIADDDRHLQRVLVDAIAEIERLRRIIRCSPVPLIQQESPMPSKGEIYGDGSTMIDHCFDGTNSEGLYKTQVAYNPPRQRGSNG